MVQKQLGELQSCVVFCRNIFCFCRIDVDLWQLRRENIKIGKKLGSGAFADVHIGDLVGDAGIKKVHQDVFFVSNYNDCEVAVKMLRLPVSAETKEDFQEVNALHL